MPTFGKTTTGSSGTGSSSSTTKVIVSQATPVENGVVQTGHAELQIDTGSVSIRFAVYADVSGSPGATPLALSDIITLNETVRTWKTFAFSGANLISFTAGIPLWIGVAFPDPGTPSVTYHRDSDAGGRREGTGFTWPDPNNPTWAAAQTGPIAAYVTYEVPSLIEPGRFLLVA